MCRCDTARENTSEHFRHSSAAEWENKLWPSNHNHKGIFILRNLDAGYSVDEDIMPVTERKRL